MLDRSHARLEWPSLLLPASGPKIPDAACGDEVINGLTVLSYFNILPFGSPPYNYWAFGRRLNLGHHVGMASSMTRQRPRCGSAIRVPRIVTSD